MSNLNIKNIEDGINRSTYKGFPIQKFPFDYVVYQMLIHKIRPDLIIEIGTMAGGSALYFADLLDAMGIEGGEVHTIDIVPFEERKHEYLVMPDPKIIHSNPHIKTFTDGWRNYDLDNCKGFNNILVIDDGSHIYEDVIGAFEKFKDIVTIGSYYIVEDGNALEMNLKEENKDNLHGGPLRGISTILSDPTTHFTVDLNWCDMFGINSTWNTYGYLRKIG